MTQAPGSGAPSRVALPAHISVHREPGQAAEPGDPYRSSTARDDVLFEVRWGSRARSLIVVFTVAWWAFLLFWFWFLPVIDAPLLFYLAPLPLIAAGAAMVYWVVALFVNRTLVSLQGELLTVRHTPLPWRGSVDLPALHIDQLFVRESVAYYVNDRPLPGFSLIARMRAGGEVTLVKDLPEPEQARYLEQVIEDALGVTDRAVPGELER